MNLSTLDLSVVAIYAIVLLVLAQWVSREKAGHQKDSTLHDLHPQQGRVGGRNCPKQNWNARLPTRYDRTATLL